MYKRINGRLTQMGFQPCVVTGRVSIMTGQNHQDFLRWARRGEVVLKREHVYRDIYIEFDERKVGLVGP